MKRRSYLGKRDYVGYRTLVELVREGTQFEPVRISGPADAYEFLRHVRNADREHLYSVMLDAANQVVGCEEVSRGSLNVLRTHPREVYKSALLANALGVILIHYVPGNIVHVMCPRSLCGEIADFSRLQARR